MRITKLPYLILLFFSTLCYSQTYNIQGTLQDESGKPIAFANAVLVDLDDINIIKGTITNEAGNFTLENLKPGDYIFKISFLGFKEYTTRIELDRDIDFEVIKIKETAQELGGVTVVAKRPTVKRMLDRLVFNVENSTLSNSNVLDVLKHAPGVFVNNRVITIKNTPPTVYINNRRVYLSSEEILQLLEGTSATNIKSVEVITNPPAKYDAEGGAVLNIITSKNIIAGYNGSIFGNFKQGSEYPKYSIGTSHFFKGEKLNTYISFNITPRKDYMHNNEYLSFQNDNQNGSSWETDFKRTRKTSNQNINANIDYELNNNNSLSFSTNMLISPRENSKMKSNSITEVFNAINVLDSIFQSTNLRVEEKFNLAFNIDYKHKFKHDGELLTANIHHTNYDFSSFQDVNTGYFLQNINESFRDNMFQTFASQKIKIYTGQIDYELPIKDSEQFEAGAKISNISSESVLNQFIFEEGEREEDIKNSNTFIYDETNYAVYSSYSKNWNNWSLNTGVRFEYTDLVGNSLSTNQENNTSFLKFFPSISISNEINDNDELYLKYNKRIRRPSYKQLNPFKFFLNDNTYITGDPNLKPRIDDLLILGYTFKKDYTFELYYRNEDNPAIQYVYQDNADKKLIYKFTNTDMSISYGLDFSTYKQIVPNWDLYILSSVFYYKNNFFPIGNSDLLYTADKWSVYLEAVNYFSFLKDNSLTANIAYTLMTPTNDGPSNTSTIAGLDINLRKKLFKDRASINIGITDVFNTQNFETSSRYLNQNILSKIRFENRMFVFGFNYKFGNFNLKNNQKNIDLEERERLSSN
ncbi:outer membrane beta-barrel protein [Thalassobellus citreus]|uniref:outer membrane beta-barrel protein n=1 Tax=Thalassobellus citreus TaxID=3367752 RepID=UPI0037B8FC83